MTKRSAIAPLEAGSPLFAYCRDSGGTTQEMSVGQQRERIAAWAQERQYNIIGWYTDERRPGSTDNREAFLAMIDACTTAKAPPR